MNNSTLELIHAFALSHDWGRTANIRQGFVFVWDELEKEWMAFNSLSSIRDWAGY
jgi:hypothetical protein